MTNQQSHRPYVSFFNAICQPPDQFWLPLFIARAQDLGLHRARYSVFMVADTARINDRDLEPFT
jgi:hypothetical protein